LWHTGQRNKRRVSLALVRLTPEKSIDREKTYGGKRRRKRGDERGNSEKKQEIIKERGLTKKT